MPFPLDPRGSPRQGKLKPGASSPKKTATKPSQDDPVSLVHIVTQCTHLSAAWGKPQRGDGFSQCSRAARFP